MRRLVPLAAALALLAGAAGAAGAPDFAALGLQAYEAPKPAPAFALPDLAGRTRTLDDYRGQAVLLFFWTTW